MTAFTERLAVLQKVKGHSTAIATTAAATDVITTVDHLYENGSIVRFATDDTLPDPLAVDTDYYVRDVSGDTYKVSATSGGAAVNITDTGTGNHTSQEVGTIAVGSHSEVSLIKSGMLRYYPDGSKSRLVATLNGDKYITRLTAAGYLT